MLSNITKIKIIGVLLTTATAFDTNSCKSEWTLVNLKVLEISTEQHNKKAIQANKHSCIGYPIKTLSEGVFNINTYKNGDPGCLEVDIIDKSDGFVLSKSYYFNEDGWGSTSIPVIPPLDGFILLQSVCEQNGIFLIDAIEFISQNDENNIIITDDDLNPEKYSNIVKNIIESYENEDSSASTTDESTTNSGTTDTGTINTDTADTGTTEATTPSDAESNTDPTTIDDEISTSFWSLKNILIITGVIAAVAVICSVTCYYIGKGQGRKGGSTSDIDDIEIPTPKVIPRAHNAYSAPQFERMREHY